MLIIVLFNFGQSRPRNLFQFISIYGFTLGYATASQLALGPCLFVSPNLMILEKS